MFYLIKFCCFCLKQQEKLINLNDKNSRSLNLLNKLMFCIKNDLDTTEVPAFICLNCYTKLEEAYEFRKMCLGNWNSFQSYVRKLKNVNPNCKTKMLNEVRIFISDLKLERPGFESDANLQLYSSQMSHMTNDLEKHTDKVDPLNLFSCHCCHESFTSEINLKMHALTHSDADQILTKCGKTFFTKHSNYLALNCNYSSINDLQKSPTHDVQLTTVCLEEPHHDSLEVLANVNISDENRIHKGILEEQPQGNKKSEGKELSSKNSAETTTTMLGRVENELIVGRTKLEIKEETEDSCNDEEDISQDYFADDKGTQNICFNSPCDTLIESNSIFIKTEPHLNMEFYSTNTEVEEYRKDYDLKSQETTEENKDINKTSYEVIDDQDYVNNSYICPVCKKQLSSNYSLKIHLQSHSENRPFSCLQCNKSFKLKQYLREHMSVHITTSSFSCALCDKKFKAQRLLKEHEQFHANQEFLVCPICKKQLRSKKNLKVHLMSHSENRPFSCSECNKSFKLKVYLTKHMSVHTTTRAYSCAVCTKNFKEHRHLKRHEKLHSK